MCGTPGRGPPCGSCGGAILVGGSALPLGISSVFASAPARGASSGSSAPVIGGANTVAGTATDCPSPESVTVLPAQLPPASAAGALAPASCTAARSEGRRYDTLPIRSSASTPAPAAFSCPVAASSRESRESRTAPASAAGASPGRR
ncbi:hypothetical protein [Actinacidiphila sp. DG2A-62]|uniref:hypothetical protein n=1 Tax=Actinacidiphila sp. DG2A-62 TaxID=3108821 RepID=UPI003FA36D6F